MFIYQVDIYYPNHPKSRITIKDDTRLGSTSQEVANWVDDLSKFIIILLTSGLISFDIRLHER